MPRIILPDGAEKIFDQPITVADIAQSIGAGLAKATIAGKIDDQLVDASTLVKNDAHLTLITAKSPEALEILRHSTAHLLAQAVKQLFPTAQVTIGPVIEDGFYYDFAFERAFTLGDLALIEKRMAELAQANLPVKRFTLSRNEAITFFENKGEHYKAEIIRDIPEGETLSLYEQGDFTDLCRGPHVPSTGHLKAFKLMKVAGAYWRGDSNREMLQRIYGTAWTDSKALEAYLVRLEEAEKRDHRKLGKALDLFHLQEEAPGMVFWHPHGWTLYQVIEAYIRKIQKQQGYREIKTPQILDRSLWVRSGHADKYSNEMFTTESESRDFAIKPMSCPCHIQVFNQGLKSYRDLPLRYAEFGICHRNELSGALHGLMRVRGFVQDDGHIFCTEHQIQSEVVHFTQSLFQIYQDFGFTDVTIKLSTRPTARIGAEELWDKAEQALEAALNTAQIPWELNPGEGAFYGPKLEFHLKDSIGRSWQCGTFQVDFQMPERLGAHYIAEDGSKKTPVMLHRAVLGTFERFIGILIEHYAGKFPTWLAPVQAVIMNITDRQAEFALELQRYLQAEGIRVEVDLRNEKIGFKIREQTLQKIPYLLVVGDKELETKTLAVRTQGGEDLGILSKEAFVVQLKQETLKESYN